MSGKPGFEEFAEFNIGNAARHSNLPFDPNKSRPWKLGWPEADEDCDQESPLHDDCSRNPLSMATALEMLHHIFAERSTGIYSATANDIAISQEWCDQLSNLAPPTADARWPHLVMAAITLARVAYLPRSRSPT